MATPIGNLGDLSPRAADALRGADLVAAEDTRVAFKLSAHLGLNTPLVRVDEHSSPQRLSSLLDRIEQGSTVAFVADAGTPGVSDPGAALADLAYRRGIPVDAIPGASAVSNALALSGFFAQRFAFLGFLPRKSGRARAELERYSGSPLTLVLFESPSRAAKTLQAALEALGERRVAICREMTKLHQEVLRGRLSDLAAAELPKKGEFTLVIEGARRGIADSD